MRRLALLLRATMASALAGVFALACAGAPAAAPAATPAAPARAVAGAPDAGNGELDPGSAQQPQPQVSPGVLIIYTGSLTLEVTDLRGTIDQATAVVTGLGGHVAASHEENSPGHEGATVTYRIPAARWSEALAGLRDLGQRVLSEDTDSQDVTAQVVDLDARIENLRASEAALQGIMARATTITDVLKVQDELTAVRAEIESMTAQRDNLADRAAMATLDVVFNVPVMAASVATGGWDLGREVDSAVASLVRIGQGLASLAVWLVIVVLPVAIPVVLALYVAVRIRRRYLARSAQQPIAPTTT